MSWRYIAQRITGPNAGEFLHWNLPLIGVELTTGIGAWWLEGTLSHSSPVLTDEDGKKLLDPWSTAIWAEENGIIRGGGILAASPYVNARQVKTVGYAGYPSGLTYEGSKKWIETDPLDIYRHLWDHVKEQIGTNLDLTIADTESTQLLGKPPKQVEFTTGDGKDVSFWSDDGPYELHWWESPNIGQTMNWLLSYTPAEVEEQHWWEGDVLKHHLHIGAPSVGRRRDDLRFALGENIIQTPEIREAYDDYANKVVALGVGEGRAMLRTEVESDDTRLRRTTVITRPAIKTMSELTTAARKELAKRSLSEHVDSIVVQDHHNAPLGSWRGGDEIYIQLNLPEGDFKQWRRIVSTKYEPEYPKRATLTLEAPHV